MPPDFGKVSKCSLHHFSYTCETRHLVTPKNTIVRFVTRKFCKKALEAKFDSQNVNNAELHFDTISVLHFSENLTPYNQYLAWKCRELKRANLIHSTWSSKSLIKIRRSTNEKQYQLNMRMIYSISIQPLYLKKTIDQLKKVDVLFLSQIMVKCLLESNVPQFLHISVFWDIFIHEMFCL